MSDKRGVLWCRVSSEEQKSGFSLDAQERILTDFAKQKGITVVRIFRVAESASTATKRREFKAMLAFIEKEKIPILIAEKIDRVTRNVADLARIYELMRGGLTVHFAREGMAVAEDSDPSVHLSFDIIAAVSAYIAKNIGREGLKGMREKAEQGGVPYTCPIGYVPIPDPADPRGKRRTVKVDEKRGPLVADMFRLYATGKFSLASLTEKMNRRGLNTRPSLTWPKAGRGSRSLTPPTIFKMLNNTFYFGEVKWKGNIYKGRHEPLITRHLFNQCQAVLRKHCHYVHPETKKQFAFKPWATCGACWRLLRAEEQTGSHNSGRYVYYHCRRPGCSNTASYKEAFIARMVEEALGGLYIDDTLAARIKSHLRESVVEQNASEKAALTRLAAEETRRTNHLNIIYQDRLDGVLTAEQYKAKAAETEAALDAVRQERERLRQTNTRFKDEGSLLIDLLRSVKDRYLEADAAGRQAILSVVLDKVVLRPDDYYVTFREPFAMLFDMKRVMKNREWGE
jgi:site-specific DNA recombinase